MTPNIVSFNFPSKNTNICGVIMVKNESYRILVTIKSIVKFIDELVIYDTGSTDDTVEKIIDFCKTNKLTINIMHGEFVDFSTSRNALLDFADSVTVSDFYLMLDCNDELQGGKELVKYCKTAPSNNAFFLKQSWKSSIIIDYYNIRLTRSKCGWRYKGVVHEYIYKDGEEPGPRVPGVVLFQDRTQDDTKSFKRFSKDKELLLKEYNSEEKTPRTVYYLAQTYECLSDKENAMKYYKERSKIINGFFEERFQAAYHVGMLCKDLRIPFEDYSGYFLLSYEIMARAEPLVRIAEYYISVKRWYQAYVYLHEACKTKVPECGLFLDIEMYKYYRWHLMGIVAYYVDERDEGITACNIAIKERNNSIDKNNLNYYKKSKKNKN
jgi:glycosyltransferase involved in cell wall biosynthesis